MTQKQPPPKKKPPPRPSEVLSMMEEAGYRFRFNVANDEIECNGRIMSDGQAAQIRCWAKEWQIGMYGKEALSDVMILGAMRNEYHPVLEYVTGIKWDGRDHIYDLCQKFKSPDIAIRYDDGSCVQIADLYLRKFLVGAIAKALHGEQNNVLVLEGPQNCGKSAFAKWLCSGMPEYFIEHPLYGNLKDMDMSLISNFIWEISELDATTAKKDIASIKAFVTKHIVETRPAYGRFRIKKPSMASFIGTVNPGIGFLADESGNRRFMCMRLERIDWSYSKDSPDQLWAQAYNLYMSGEKWTLSAIEKTYQTERNKAFDIESPIEDFIRKYFDITGNKYDFVQTTDIIQTLRKNEVVLNPNRSTSMEISRSMARLGAKKSRDGSIRGYSGIRKIEATYQPEYSEDEPVYEKRFEQQSLN